MFKNVKYSAMAVRKMFKMLKIWRNLFESLTLMSSSLCCISPGLSMTPGSQRAPLLLPLAPRATSCGEQQTSSTRAHRASRALLGHEVICDSAVVY